MVIKRTRVDEESVPELPAVQLVSIPASRCPPETDLGKYIASYKAGDIRLLNKDQKHYWLLKHAFIDLM